MAHRWRAVLRLGLLLVALVAVVAIAWMGIRMVFGREAAGERAVAPPQQGPPGPSRSLTQILLGLYISLHQSEINQSVNPEDTRLLSFRVTPGETAATIGPRLQLMGLISDANLFSALVRYRSVDNSLEVGEYRLSPSMTLDQIITELQHGRVRTVTVTIPEGWRMEQVAAKLSQAGLAKADAFLGLMRRHDYPYPWLQDRPEGAPAGLEGFLFPDTYQIPVDATPEAIVDTMLRNFDRRVTPDLRKDLTKQGLSLYEAIVLASIVEREAVVPGERPLIAAVFLNRLDRGMYLQADPTVSYAKGFDQAANRWWTPMLEEDSENIDSPYNTFLHGGLPPGPICSPGLASIAAVGRPARTTFFYFVSKGDGSHAFAETFEQHLANMQEFPNR